MFTLSFLSLLAHRTLFLPQPSVDHWLMKTFCRKRREWAGKSGNFEGRPIVSWNGLLVWTNNSAALNCVKINCSSPTAVFASWSRGTNMIWWLYKALNQPWLHYCPNIKGLWTLRNSKRWRKLFKLSWLKSLKFVSFHVSKCVQGFSPELKYLKNVYLTITRNGCSREVGLNGSC